jgi:hypothetical protein
MAQTAACWLSGRVDHDNLGPGHGETNRRFDQRVEHLFVGCLAEQAVAKHYGVYWDGGAEGWKRPDVCGVQVRGTTHENGHLILYESEPLDTIGLLVCVQTPAPGEFVVCRIVGSHQRDGAEAYPPPAGKLRPGSPPQFWIPQRALCQFAGSRRALDGKDTDG